MKDFLNNLLRKCKFILYISSFLFIFVILTILSLANKDYVKLNFSPLEYEVNIRLFILIILIFVTAFISGYFFALFKKNFIKKKF